ncbi:MAG: branched-chain amino acid ABC transporter permease [Candidatus Binatia bacterium]
MKRRLTLYIGIGIGALALILVPRFVTTYYTGLLTQMLIFAILAMSLDLLLGYTGLPSLGHAAFFGTAAYTVGIFSARILDNFWLELAIGMGMVGFMAALFGLLALRAHGAYFLMITLALAQVLWGIAFGWRSMTGGDDGLPGIPRPDWGLPWSLWDTVNFYYFVLAFFIIAAGIMYVIVRSPFGHALVGIRESESRMKVLGYNVWMYKYVAFILAGVFAGLAGALFVYYNGFVSPTELSIIISAEALLMVILGGPGTLFGPAVGAGVIVFLENIISAYTERWLLILGIIYVLVVLFAPKGVYGAIRGRLGRKAEA